MLIKQFNNPVEVRTALDKGRVKSAQPVAVDVRLSRGCASYLVATYLLENVATDDLIAFANAPKTREQPADAQSATE